MTESILNFQRITSKVLQLMKSRDASDLNGIVNSIIDDVYPIFAHQKEYYVIGHSFGALVAMKIASMLEKMGKIGHVILIDGSPDQLVKLTRGMHRATKIHDNLEDDLITVLFRHFCSSELLDGFIAKLVACENLSRKIELLSGHISSEFKSNYSEKYMLSMLKASFNRLKVIMNLNIEADKLANIMDHKLKSTITLIRPTQTSFAQIADDYELHKYSEREIIVKYVDGNHLTVLENIELANILNELTSQTIHES